MKKQILFIVLAEVVALNSGTAQQSPWSVYSRSELGLTSNNVTAVAVDSGDQVWIGTDSGVAKLIDRGVRVSAYRLTDPSVTGCHIYCVVPYGNGKCWVGTDRGLARFDGTEWTLYNSTNSVLASDIVYSVALDQDGNAWVGTYNGLVRFGAGGSVAFNTRNSGLPGNMVYAVAVDHYSSVWACTNQGLGKLSGTSWTVYNTENSSLPGKTVSAIVIDRSSRVWVATPGQGLACLDGTKWTAYKSANSGLVNDRVYSIALDLDAAKWIGTAAGLSYLNGNGWTNYDPSSSPMRGKEVHALSVDNEGTVWIGTDSGLVAFSRQTPANQDLKRFIVSKQNNRALEILQKLFDSKGLNQLGYTGDFIRSFSDLLKRGDTEVALSIVGRLERLNIRYPVDTFVELGDLFKSMGNSAETIRILVKVLQVDPHNETAKLKLGEAYYSAGRYDDVIAYYGGTEDEKGSRYVALSYEKKLMLAEADEVWRAIAGTSHNTVAVEEAQNHIRQNTITMLSPGYQAPKREAAVKESSRVAAQPGGTNDKESAGGSYSPENLVDTNIPRGLERSHSGVALILALSDYQNSGIPTVKYAKDDAKAIRKYLINALGFRPENILPRNPDEQLTYGRIQTYIRSILPSYLKPDGSSDLFVYFTGHGAPSTETHEAYLVPWDGDPNYVNDNNSYSMKKFYVDLELLNARHKIIVVDACFSGFAGNGTSLMKYASPALLKVNNPLIADPSTVIFQSSSPDQVSNWYDAKRHGMFTYFFLKGLQGAADLNGDGTITAGEMIKFVDNPDDGLPYYSNRLYQRPQKAQLEGDSSMVIEKIAN